jgi:hypothetical protein
VDNIGCVHFNLKDRHVFAAGNAVSFARILPSDLPNGAMAADA